MDLDSGCLRFIGREPLVRIGHFIGGITVAKKTGKTKTTGAKTRRESQRKVVVFSALLMVMTVTSALLLALAPAPLTPGASASLFAVGTPDSLDAIFQTPAPVQPGRWRYVYVHHSRTDAGSAATLGESPDGLADHFVIGNGDGCGDGEVQIAQRWQRQKPAGRVAGVDSIDSACVSICLIGDFNRARPTETQVRRLAQLVSALQARCDIPAANIHFRETDSTPAGIGHYFPAVALRGRLLP